MGDGCFSVLGKKTLKYLQHVIFFYLGFIINMKRKSALFGFAKII